MHNEQLTIDDGYVLLISTVWHLIIIGIVLRVCIYRMYISLSSRRSLSILLARFAVPFINFPTVSVSPSYRTIEGAGQKHKLVVWDGG